MASVIRPRCTTLPECGVVVTNPATPHISFSVAIDQSDVAHDSVRAAFALMRTLGGPTFCSPSIFRAPRPECPSSRSCPSWQAYSYTGPGVATNGYSIVQAW